MMFDLMLFFFKCQLKWFICINDAFFSCLCTTFDSDSVRSNDMEETIRMMPVQSEKKKWVILNYEVGEIERSWEIQRNEAKWSDEEKYRELG